MIYDYTRTMAYICPYCSTVSQRTFTAFDFSGSGALRVDCSMQGCGEKCAAIVQNTKKYKIEIACPICAETHTFFVPYNNMWKKNILTFKCPESTIDVFFIGKQEYVNSKIEQSIEAYKQMMEEYEAENEEVDLIVEIINRLEELSREDNIKCTCGNRKIKPVLLPDRIDMVCGECGRHAEILLDDASLMELLMIEEFIIC